MKVVHPQKFRSYFIFRVVVILLQRLVYHCLIATFDLSLSYYDVLFVIGLLRHDVFRRLVATLYLCGSNSDMQNIFN